MELNVILISMASMGGLGILFSAGLSIANRVFYVEEDPRIGEVLDALPGANCGGCGYPGCAAFAEAIVKGAAEISGCPVNTADGVEEIGEIMGIEATAGEKMIARVLCSGGVNEAAIKAEYRGIRSCLAAHISGGGDKLCEYGCLGYGDCVRSCPFDAIVMNANGLPDVIVDKCTGCGNCVDACPRDIIELHPESHKLFILCKNEDTPKESRTICTRACIGCGICVRAVNPGEIVMENNRAKIDYSVFGTQAKLPTEKCSAQSLVVLGTQEEIEKAKAETPA